jgi:hypothetical protein
LPTEAIFRVEVKLSHSFFWNDPSLLLRSAWHHPLLQHPELRPLRYCAVGDEAPLGRFVRAVLRQLVQELLKSGPEFPVLAEGPKTKPTKIV